MLPLAYGIYNYSRRIFLDLLRRIFTSINFTVLDPDPKVSEPSCRVRILLIRFLFGSRYFHKLNLLKKSDTEGSGSELRHHTKACVAAIYFRANFFL